jgi:precorrin-6B methylase 2
MSKEWTGEDVLRASRGFQVACVVHAAAELDVVAAVAEGGATGDQLAAKIDGDPRATAMLADALAALGLLVKRDGRYSPAPGAAEALTAGGPDSALAMVRHQANCLRAYNEAFIEAMEVASRAAAGPLVEAIGPPPFTHLLDVGGGPATWTIAFLRAAPEATATLYDRPGVIGIAERHLREAGLLDRVTLVAGDFYADETLPGGADLAWVSAIVHQNSRRQNRELLTKVHAALAPGGRVLIRDVVMDASRTQPAGGAMFAINMLVHTPGGGTFTFEELREDLAAAGFAEARFVRTDPYMNAVVEGRRIDKASATSR